MALNNGQARDVNILLRWILGVPATTGGVPSDSDARDAAALLCGAAYKKSSAGLRPEQVVEHWPPNSPAQSAEVRAAAERLRMDVYETIQAAYGEIGGHSDNPDAAEADQRRIVADLRLVLDWTATAAGGAR